MFTRRSVILTDDERHLLCELLRNRLQDLQRPAEAGMVYTRLLGKLEGADKRLILETDTPLGTDEAVARALASGC